MKTLLLLFSYVITALPGFSQEQKTLEDQLIIITVYTKQNNYIKGLLHEISDTSVTVYPGDKNEYLAGNQYKKAVFHYQQIKLIKTKKQNKVLKNTLVGGSIGLSIGILSVLNVHPEEAGKVAMITVPAGALTGMVTGLTFRKKYPINGRDGPFKDFTRAY